MKKKDCSTGINRFANVIEERLKQNILAGKSLVLDFGSVQSDYSLLTNTFPISIPRSDYLVCGGCCESGTQQHAVGPGSRVLVAWVQNDAVVIDEIFSAEHLIWNSKME